MEKFEIRYYCSKCQKRISEADVLCANCGNKTDENGRYHKKISLRKKILRKRAKVCAILAIVCGIIGMIPLLNFVFLPIAITLVIIALLSIRKIKKKKIRILNLISVVTVSLSVVISALYTIPTILSKDNAIDIDSNIGEKIEFTAIELDSIFEELKNNSARGQVMYENNYYEFCGILSIISKDSFSIKSLNGETVTCSVENDNVSQMLLTLNDDDYVKVRAKITKAYSYSMSALVYEISKPEVFSYNGFYFGMEVNEVREKETNKSLTNGAIEGNGIPYIVNDSYIDEFGYNPDFITYGFHSFKLSKITITYSDVDLTFFNTVVNKLSKKYGEPAKTYEYYEYTKRIFTDSVLITIYYYDDTNTAGIIYMYPAYYSLSAYLSE